MASILVVDDMAICREPIVAALREKGYTVNSARNGKEALQLIESARPDLVLLDVSMPQMDGWEVLRILRRNPNHKELPVILLTATADRHSVLQARELGVHSYLVKEAFNLEELFNRVSAQLNRVAANVGAGGGGANTIAASTTSKATKRSRPQLTREQTLERVDKRTNTKTLPGCIAEVIAVASSPRASRENLVALLTRDPILCTRVLQLANSAAFTTGGSQVTTVDEAVRRIGLSAVRNIATSVGIFEAFPMSGENATELFRCWQHCFGVAALMERLVAESEETPAGLSQLIGLCHDLVEIVLRQEFAEEFAKASEMVAQNGQLFYHAVETMLGIPQAELNDLVLGRLGLPDAIVLPIRQFMRATCSTGSLQGSLLKSPLAQSLALADLYANALQLASGLHVRVRPMLKSELSGIISEAQIDGMGIRGSAIATTSLLARVSPAQQALLCKPLIEKSGVALWYARYSTYSPFDPLAAALELLAVSQTHDRLPKVPELSQCQGLVVATPRPGIDPFSLAQIDQLRRQAGLSELPVLMLSALPSDALPPAPAGIRYATYPISLSDLRAFIQPLDQSKIARDADAA